ncbi:MAG: hypothetical protein KatS3mg111_4238 [Pirellulaceae bacterium]|nr:MAG: hypothetical protein KatS3mg111_4238 [Pirellulaceae bacterium]
MANHAEVRSLARLQRLQTRMGELRHQTVQALEQLQLQLRRLTQWIETDAPAYWAEQYRRSQLDVVQAQEALSRCMATVRDEERRPCTEQKKRLIIARQRQELCATKLRAARAAARAWQQSMTKQTARMLHCRDVVEGDLYQGLQRLQRYIDILHRYTNDTVPSRDSVPQKSLAPDRPQLVVDEDAAVKQKPGEQLGSEDTC